MRSVADIIDGLGGNAFVSRELGLKPSAVSEMKRRGSVPPRYWPGLIRIAERDGVQGVSSDTLMTLHAAPTEAAA